MAAGFVCGLAQAASLALPGSGQPVWWLQLASMAVLAWLLRPHGLARAAGLGWVFATAWLVGTFWWLYISHAYPTGVLRRRWRPRGAGAGRLLGSYYAVSGL